MDLFSLVQLVELECLFLLLSTLIDHLLYSSLKKWLISYYPITVVLAVVVHKQHSAISTQGIFPT